MIDLNTQAAEVFEVRVREYKGVELCSVGKEPVYPGDVVVIDRGGELECGDVITESYHLSDLAEMDGDQIFMVRKATQADVERWKENQAIEREAFIAARGKIKDRELSMKLIRVESSLDRKKLRFYFTSDSRVDFRELVKDLAYLLKARIEMRQVGVRDEARMIGGYSHCGREFCCASHLRNFDPVTIRMAKDQNLALNPAKISGSCGRLMCCLAYEYQHYRESRKRFPKVGTKLTFRGKPAIVTDIDLLRDIVTVEMEEAVIRISISEYDEERKVDKHPKEPEPEPQIDSDADCVLEEIEEKKK